MNYSAQTIVVDENGRIYLEDNKVICALSFFWWKLEPSESFLDAAVREIHEELGLKIHTSRFLDWREQKLRTFWNEKKQCFLDWKSTYFVLVLYDFEVKEIQWNIDILIFHSVNELDNYLEGKFIPLGKHKFLEEIQRALSHIS